VGWCQRWPPRFRLTDDDQATECSCVINPTGLHAPEGGRFVDKRVTKTPGGEYDGVKESRPERKAALLRLTK
jgi:hypothetical protein